MKASVTAAVTVVVPAHNEEQVIGRLLRALSDDSGLAVLVACNGCTDATAGLAQSFDRVQVLDLPHPGKSAALRMADVALGDGFPRVYVDADVEIDAAGVRRLVAGLAEPGVLAAAPHRVVSVDGRPWLVRAYYQVWERLPSVHSGIYGRGVLAVTAAGHRRLAALPDVLADDLAASQAFSANERAVVPDAVVRVHAPRTVRDLLRRRARVTTGVAQVREVAPGADGLTATSPHDLAMIVRREPRLVPATVAYVGIVALGRVLAARSVRRRDFTTWQRDESSRAEAGADPRAVGNELVPQNAPQC